MLVLSCIAAPCSTHAQASASRFSLDSLQLSAVSIDIGRIRPSQAERAQVFGITTDYGALRHNLRLRFEAAYWDSRLTDDVVRTYTDSLRRVVADPSRDDIIAPSQVTLYDVTMGIGLRWQPFTSTVLQPFAGAGVDLHVLNAEGPLIDGTFVERLFDSVNTGPFAEAGIVLKPLPRVGVEALVRGDLMNGFRSVSLRLGGIYYFGPLRRSQP